MTHTQQEQNQFATNKSNIPFSQNATEIYKDGTYLGNNNTWHVEESPWKATQIITILKNNNIVPENVCEVGCGAGEILKQLSSSLTNAKFVGYEISPQAFELCKIRESEKTKYLNKNIFEDDVFFDCLLCIDVFEHVEDYIGFIKSLKVKATYKIFHIPLDISVLSVLRSVMMTNRLTMGHIHYFTPETAIATLKDSGYEILDSFYTTWFDVRPSKTIKAKIANLHRKILFSLSPNLMVRLLGGCSLIVLAK